MKVDYEVIAVPQDEVLALNYRKKPATWDRGFVTGTKIRVREDGKHSAVYRVELWGQTYGISVGDASIKLI